MNQVGSLAPVKRISEKVSVQTPEQIQFEFELAGVSARMMAYLLDLLIRAGIISVVSTILVLTTSWASEGLSAGLVLILAFVVEWGYNTLLEWRFNGVTPGKKALGIRVVRTDGVSIDFVRSAMRNFLRAADIFPFFYAAGVLTMFFTGTQRRLGDLAADTMVIREKRSPLRELPPLPSNLVEIPTGALMQLGIRDRDLTIIDEFFRRRHLFSEDRADEIAAVLGDPVAKKLKIEGEDPELVLAGMLVAGNEVRSSWYGRSTATSIPGTAGGAR